MGDTRQRELRDWDRHCAAIDRRQGLRARDWYHTDGFQRWSRDRRRETGAGLGAGVFVTTSGCHLGRRETGFTFSFRHSSCSD